MGDSGGEMVDSKPRAKLLGKRKRKCDGESGSSKKKNKTNHSDLDIHAKIALLRKECADLDRKARERKERIEREKKLERALEKKLEQEVSLRDKRLEDAGIVPRKRFYRRMRLVEGPRLSKGDRENLKFIFKECARLGSWKRIKRYLGSYAMFSARNIVRLHAHALVLEETAKTVTAGCEDGAKSYADGLFSIDSYPLGWFPMPLLLSFASYDPATDRWWPLPE